MLKVKSKNEIKAFAREMGLPCGFAPVRDYSELVPILEKRGDTPYVKTCEKRITPYICKKNVQSIIVFLLPYQKGNHNSVAKYLRNGDYHGYVKGKLKQIAEFIGGSSKILVDSGGLPDRYLAYLAGLGYYGYNNLLYCDEFGSRFYIGSILSDIYYEPDEKNTQECLKCGKCLHVCKAITEKYTFNYKMCYSYLNQNHIPLKVKGEFSSKFTIKKSLKKPYFTHKPKYFSLYKTGCDLCTDICPLNINK